MKLNELFDSPTEMVRSEWNEHYGEVVFIIGQHQYSIEIFDVEGAEEEWGAKLWELQFSLLGGGTASGKTFNNTGTGNFHAILSNVAIVVRDYLSEFGVRPIKFDAAEKKNKIYIGLVKKSLKGWQVRDFGGIYVAIPPGSEYDVLFQD